MAVRQYVGARYVPKFKEPDIKWESGISYEGMTIVTYNNDSYTSKKTVPANIGTPPSNPEYWALTGNFNGQLNETVSQAINAKEAATKALSVVQQEVTDRKSADSDLEGKIANEATARQEADTNLEDEISNALTVAQSASTNLQTEINNRKSADTELQNAINSEASARQTADNLIEGKITAEATARQNADNDITNTVDGLSDTVDTHGTQLNGLYFGKNSSGEYGYKTSATGEIIPFKKAASATGDATTSDVLSGKTFSNASGIGLTGTMANNGSKTVTLTPTGASTVTQTLDAGYYSGITVNADGTSAYNAGKAAGPTISSITSSANVARYDQSASFSLTSIPDYASKTLWKNLFPSLSGLQQWCYDSDELTGTVNLSYKPSSGTLTVTTNGARLSSWNGTTQTITVYYY